MQDMVKKTGQENAPQPVYKYKSKSHTYLLRVYTTLFFSPVLLSILIM